MTLLRIPILPPTCRHRRSRPPATRTPTRTRSRSPMHDDDDVRLKVGPREGGATPLVFLGLPLLPDAQGTVAALLLRNARETTVEIATADPPRKSGPTEGRKLVISTIDHLRLSPAVGQTTGAPKEREGMTGQTKTLGIDVEVGAIVPFQGRRHHPLAGAAETTVTRTRPSRDAGTVTDDDGSRVSRHGSVTIKIVAMHLTWRMVSPSFRTIYGYTSPLQVHVRSSPCQLATLTASASEV